MKDEFLDESMLNKLSRPNQNINITPKQQIRNGRGNLIA